MSDVWTPELHAQLERFVEDLRASGQPLHLSTLSTHAISLLERNGLGHFLEKNGGPYKFGDPWAHSWLKNRGIDYFH